MKRLPPAAALDLASLKRLVASGRWPARKLLDWLEGDTRAGVAALRAAIRAKAEAVSQEAVRLRGMGRLERAAAAEGFELIAGADEAGRGPLAGPLVAAAVILPKRSRLPSLNDSKQLSRGAREGLFRLICAQAVAKAVVVVSVDYIDTHNIHRANLEGLRRAVMALKPEPALVLADGFRVPGLPCPCQAVVHGDSLSVSIAAASVLAKVTRDRLMDSYHEAYPVYGFDRHRGYATREHREAIAAHGPCPLHRRSFSLVQGDLFAEA